MRYFIMMSMMFTSKKVLNCIAYVIVNDCGAEIISGEFIYLIHVRFFILGSFFTCNVRILFDITAGFVYYSTIDWGKLSDDKCCYSQEYY